MLVRLQDLEPNRMRILIIEDDFDHIELERRICVDAFGFDTHIHHSPELEPGLERLLARNYDVCLCDLSFPTSSAKETVAQLRSLKDLSHAPIIVLTSFADESNVHDLLHHGIQDFMLKSELSASQLRRVVTFAIERQKYHHLLEERNLDQQAFISSLSHDFKGKIGNINQTSSILQKSLQREFELSDKHKELFDYISDSSSTIMQLVEGLTTYLRVNQSEKERLEIDVVPIIQEVINSLRQEYNLDPHNLRFKFGPITQIKGDETQIYLMLQNLINNAIKFSDGEPEVLVRLDHHASEEQTVLTIRDKGLGMTEKQRDRIFEPFQRAHEGVEGTGLGLSIVKRIVQAHEGKIQVDSEPGVGTTFTIILPDH